MALSPAANLSRHSLTSSRGTNLHLIHTLLTLADPPQLILLGTRQPHSRRSLRSIPTSLAILKPEHHPRPLTEPLSINTVLLIGHLGRDPLKVAHVGVTMALLGFLRGPVEPAQLVLVLARIGADALSLERAEDVVWAVILGQIALLVGELGGLGGVLGAGGLEGFARGDHQLGFHGPAGRRVVGEDAVLDQPDFEGGDLGVDEGADRRGEIGFEVVD